jgi:hypothetical protein
VGHPRIEQGVEATDLSAATEGLASCIGKETTMEKHCGMLTRVGELTGGEMLTRTHVDERGDTLVVNQVRLATEIDMRVTCAIVLGAAASAAAEGAEPPEQVISANPFGLLRRARVVLRRRRVRVEAALRKRRLRPRFVPTVRLVNLGVAF